MFWGNLGVAHFLSSFFIAPGVKRKRQKSLFEEDVVPFPTSGFSTITPAQLISIFNSFGLMSTIQATPGVYRALKKSMDQCGVSPEEAHSVAQSFSEWSKTLEKFDGFTVSVISRKLPEWIGKHRNINKKKEKQYQNFRRNKV